MNRKKIGAGLIALSFPVIALSMSVGSANAASVTSTVTAMDVCQWKVAGVPTTIALSSASKYVGEALVVSSAATDTVQVRLSGSVDTWATVDAASTECTFYNNQSSAALDVAMSSTSVRATYPGVGGAPTEDPLLSFTVGEEKPFAISTASDCEASFTVSRSTINLTGGPATTMVSRNHSTLGNDYAAGAAPKCSISTGYSLTIPAISGVPASPGAVYSFSGGSVAFVFSTTPKNG
jgi:hypothetical protein